MVAEFMGWQKHLHLRAETTWGVRSTAEPDIYLPYTNYNVSSRVSATQSDLFTGLRMRRHSRVQRATVTGSLRLPLFAHHQAGKSIAQHLLEWGTSSPQSPMVDSKTADVFEGNTDNKRHLGLRVSTMTLTGEAQTGAISIEFELEGKEELGGIAPPTLTATAPPPAEFLFDDVSMFLSTDDEAEAATGDEERIDLRSFRLRLDNALRVYHTTSFFPSCVVAGVRTVTFQFSAFKTSNMLDLLRRSNNVNRRACRLQLKGRHLGTAATGTFTVINIYLDQLYFTGAQDQVQLNELVTQDAEWIAIKPATSASEIEMAFGLST